MFAPQRGTKFHAGRNVMRAGYDNQFAIKDGKVKFETKRGERKFVNIDPV